MSEADFVPSPVDGICELCAYSVSAVSSTALLEAINEHHAYKLSQGDFLHYGHKPQLCLPPETLEAMS